MNEQELEALGYTAKFDYSQYSHDNNINVIPEGNIELRSDIGHYSEGLKDNGKFVLVSPKQLMQPIKETHQDLYNYLETRYWQ